MEEKSNKPNNTKKARSQKRQFVDQEADEEVIRISRQFPIVLRKGLIIGLLIILLGLVPWAVAYANDYGWLGASYGWMLAMLVVLAWYWLRAWVGWYYSVYMLTNQRIVVVTQQGFFNRKVAELALSNIQNVNYQVTGFQSALFGYGTIEIQTLSGAGGMSLGYVHRPAEFARNMLKYVHTPDLADKG